MARFFKENNWPITPNQIFLEKKYVNQDPSNNHWKGDDDFSDLFLFLQRELRNPWAVRLVKGNKILWNYEKFLVFDGKPTERYGAQSSPSSMESKIKWWIHNNS